VRRFFKTLFGISLSRGGSTHVVLRSARRSEPIYTAIRDAVRESPWVVPDETGWRVGGRNAWLHGFVGQNATAYIIDPTRSGEPARELLGADYDGFVIHDGWSPYDGFTSAIHQQCLGHLVRRAREMLETATSAAARFPRRIRDLLQHGLKLRDRHEAGDLSAHGLAVCRGRLDNDIFKAIYGTKTNPDNERFARHLRKHWRHLLTFLKHPSLDATNWRAEHAMRFAVILRKVWGGSRTWAGAWAQSALMSVWRTCWQREHNPVNFLSRLLRHGAALVPLPP
jgi:transposase